MARYDFKTRRLFVEWDLRAGGRHELDRTRSSYLLNVLRMDAGDPVLIFNGRDGEWQATIEPQGRKLAAINVAKQTREQTPNADLHLMFAPLKQSRLDYMIQKAVEMGVGLLQPVATQYTQSAKVRSDKLGSYIIEAAQQCGVLALPTLREIAPLTQALEVLDPDRDLVFCDEDAELADPVAALKALSGQRISVLIGPEGGFSQEERALLAAQKNVTRISLGPRILRADTAAVAALTLVQAVAGDWCH